ncbi:hypothetical protein AYO45_02050 [Gammaproteobacteria bacterium SCGC AG-212-F23]|nr:hypothetical protein AYO45_02050 [Gammaproteobacteria bacterium SCGC AG-212-F23]
MTAAANAPKSDAKNGNEITRKLLLAVIENNGPEEARALGNYIRTLSPEKAAESYLTQIDNGENLQALVSLTSREDVKTEDISAGILIALIQAKQDRPSLLRPQAEQAIALIQKKHPSIEPWLSCRKYIAALEEKNILRKIQQLEEIANSNHGIIAHLACREILKNIPNKNIDARINAFELFYQKSCVTENRNTAILPLRMEILKQLEEFQGQNTNNTRISSLLAKYYLQEAKSMMVFDTETARDFLDKAEKFCSPTIKLQDTKDSKTTVTATATTQTSELAESIKQLRLDITYKEAGEQKATEETLETLADKGHLTSILITLKKYNQKSEPDLNMSILNNIFEKVKFALDKAIETNNATLASDILIEIKHLKSKTTGKIEQACDAIVAESFGTDTDIENIDFIFSRLNKEKNGTSYIDYSYGMYCDILLNKTKLPPLLQNGIKPLLTQMEGKFIEAYEENKTLTDERLKRITQQPIPYKKGKFSEDFSSYCAWQGQLWAMEKRFELHKKNKDTSRATYWACKIAMHPETSQLKRLDMREYICQIKSNEENKNRLTKEEYRIARSRLYLSLIDMASPVTQDQLDIVIDKHLKSSTFSDKLRNEINKSINQARGKEKFDQFYSTPIAPLISAKTMPISSTTMATATTAMAVTTTTTATTATTSTATKHHSTPMSTALTLTATSMPTPSAPPPVEKEGEPNVAVDLEKEGEPNVAVETPTKEVISQLEKELQNAIDTWNSNKDSLNLKKLLEIQETFKLAFNKTKTIGYHLKNYNTFLDCDIAVSTTASAAHSAQEEQPGSTITHSSIKNVGLFPTPSASSQTPHSTQPSKSNKSKRVVLLAGGGTSSTAKPKLAEKSDADSSPPTPTRRSSGT